MTYDQRRETLRFAWRNIRFVFAVLGFVAAGNETKGESLILRSGAERRVSKEIQKAPPGPPFETRLRRSSGRGL
jgi:hypothetical protein